MVAEGLDAAGDVQRALGRVPRAHLRIVDRDGALEGRPIDVVVELSCGDRHDLASSPDADLHRLFTQPFIVIGPITLGLHSSGDDSASALPAARPGQQRRLLMTRSIGTGPLPDQHHETCRDRK